MSMLIISENQKTLRELHLELEKLANERHRLRCAEQNIAEQERLTVLIDQTIAKMNALSQDSNGKSPTEIV